MQSSQNQMSSPMGPQGGGQAGQVMSPSGQPMAQMSMGQFQIIQPQMGHTAPYTPMYTQQGQIVLQPANFAFPSLQQQPGGQTMYITAPQQLQQQKPGQPTLMAQNQSQAGKTMVPMTMAPGTSYTITNSNGTQQTFMIANPMGGVPILGTTQTMAQTSMAGQMKQEIGKHGQSQQQVQQQAAAQVQQAAVAAQQQPILMTAQGMPYMASAQGQPTQAFIQNGQVFFRPQMQDGSQPQMMFTSAPQHSLPQQPTMQQAPTHQQLPPGLTGNMQPISLQQTTANANQMRPPVSMPSQAPPGKTPISRNIAPLLPSVSTTTSSMRHTGYSTITSSSSGNSGPGASPKGKQKMSPRSSGGQVGRPPGPAKSAVNNLKMASSTNSPVSNSMSPPVLPNSPHFATQPNSPMSLGPPVLQTSLPVVPVSRGSPHLPPPTLQPMLPTIPTSAANAGSADASRYMGKNDANQPPTLSANAPMPNMDNSRKFDAKSNASSRKPDDKYSNGDSTMDGPFGNNSASMNGSESSTHTTPKAVVKPNVLTHVIDGHIIQESSQPFPLDNSESKGRHYNNDNRDVEMPEVRRENSHHHTSSASLASTTTTTTFTSSTALTTPISSLNSSRILAPKPGQISTPTPPYTSSADPKSKLSPKPMEALSGSEKKRGPGRPPGSTKQNLDQHKSVTQIGGNDIKDGPPLKKSKLEDAPLKVSTTSPTSPTKPSKPSPNSLNIDMTNNNPLKWTVTQVCDFVKSLPGCSDYVEDFQLQEIDGQALMLLKADHLMSAMAIKLGPALKICSAIDAMREELKQN